MESVKKTTIMDKETMQRTLKRIAHQIIENTDGADGLYMIGIQRRGVTIAKRIASYIKEFEGVDIPLGTLDITFYRDDLSKDSEQPVVGATHIDFDVTDKKIVLVDDVLYTGRTARAAIEAVFTCGRPRSIQLAVLVDRGHRELPIRADFVGKNIPTSHSELVEVRLPEYDGETGVYLMDLTAP